MTKYVLLYSGGSMPESEAEQAQVMKAWEAWYTGLGNAVVDPGYPFTPVAKSVASDGAVSDGPKVGMASGYTIVQAESIDSVRSGDPFQRLNGSDVSYARLSELISLDSPSSLQTGVKHPARSKRGRPDYEITQ